MITTQNFEKKNRNKFEFFRQIDVIMMLSHAHLVSLIPSIYLIDFENKKCDDSDLEIRKFKYIAQVSHRRLPYNLNHKRVGNSINNFFILHIVGTK